MHTLVESVEERLNSAPPLSPLEQALVAALVRALVRERRDENAPSRPMDGRADARADVGATGVTRDARLQGRTTAGRHRSAAKEAAGDGLTLLRRDRP
jgi:hypothetical protein